MRIGVCEQRAITARPETLVACTIVIIIVHGKGNAEGVVSGRVFRDLRAQADSDSEKVPAALYDRLTDTPTYAARMYKVQQRSQGSGRTVLMSSIRRDAEPVGRSSEEPASTPHPAGLRLCGTRRRPCV